MADLALVIEDGHLASRGGIAQLLAIDQNAVLLHDRLSRKLGLGECGGFGIVGHVFSNDEHNYRNCLDTFWAF